MSAKNHFQSIIFANRLKTYAVLVVYAAIFVCIGLLGDVVRLDSLSLSEGLLDLLSLREPPLITLGLLAVAVVVICFCVGNSARIMLSGNEYKLIDPSRVLSRRESVAYGALRELLDRARCPFEPRLYIMDAPYMNAFASGWDSQNSMIALTSALVENLSPDELKAVIAHELSHIRHGDVRLTMCVGILSNIMLLGVNIFAFYFSSSQNQGARTARGILLALQFILPLLTLILSLFISRSREYMADSGAAFLMSDSEPMVRALQKIAKDYEQNRYTEPNPTRASAYLFDSSEILSTHPSIPNRIRALLSQRY